MSRIIPFHGVPDSNIFPDGIFRLKVDKLEEGTSREREGKPAKVMFKLTSKVIEPPAYKGMLFFENFVVGNDDDPEAELLETWQTSFGARNLKKLANKTGVPFADEEDSDAFCAAIKDQEYLATIVQKVDDGSKDPKYKGQVRNNVTAYWSIGEKETGVVDGQAGTPLPASKKPGAKPAAKPAPSDDVTCTACRKRVPRAQLKAHVDAHMKELATSAGAEASEEE